MTMENALKYKHVGTSFVLMVALALAGCDSVSNTMDASGPAATNPAVARLVDDLALDPRQVEALQPALDDLGERSPETLWKAAASLQQTLTAEQKTRLMERARENDRGPAMAGRAGRAHQDGANAEGMRRGRHGGARDSSAAIGERGAFRRGDRSDGAGRAEQMTAAMVDVLGLTAEQQQQLKALRESQRGQMEAMRDATPADSTRRASFMAMRETHRAAMEAILTEAQRETIAIHRALLFSAHEPSGRGGKRSAR
ncbi:MAG: hypothetical protein SH809_03660 [Rhodothermales bacterium]|nr:hypothetical protein [Rhodothermales bacterium]